MSHVRFLIFLSTALEILSAGVQSPSVVFVPCLLIETQCFIFLKYQVSDLGGSTREESVSWMSKRQKRDHFCRCCHCCIQASSMFLCVHVLLQCMSGKLEQERMFCFSRCCIFFLTETYRLATTSPQLYRLKKIVHVMQYA